ncbi:hypothetical protein SAMN05444278_1263 [Psychroflexus salarius]|uniref:Uncharacterized protein n=1 Tax=Psychroflexus salarius TaxID=1155689 RepID=A0A1M4YEC3_9FLAO|nr:hypothetical protein SAMN05444278_1263 [Psychroflexus salarius]
MHSTTYSPKRWGQFEMKKILKLKLIFLLIIFSSCKEKSKFFDCECEKINLSKSLTITDSLNHYRINYPNENWLPLINLDSIGSGIVVADKSLGYLRSFGVIEKEKEFDFNNWEVQQKSIEKEFNIIEKGEVDFFNQQAKWNLVKIDKNKPIIWTLYLTFRHPKDDKFYTLNLTVEDQKNVRNKICNIESLIYGFKIIE